MPKSSPDIIIFMVIRNACSRQALVERVVSQAANVSSRFFVVDHGSDDGTATLFGRLRDDLKLDMELVRAELADGNMDAMKGKYYRLLRERHTGTRTYIFIIDWDEVVTDGLVDEIRHLTWDADVYWIHRNKYLIREVIDRGGYMPLFFQVDSVEIGPFALLHDLYRVRSKNTKRLTGILEHFSYTSVSDIFRKTFFYAGEEAAVLYAKDPNISHARAFILALYYSTRNGIYIFIFRHNYRHVEGWFYTVVSGLIYFFVKYLLYMELQTKAKDSQKK